MHHESQVRKPSEETPLVNRNRAERGMDAVTVAPAQRSETLLPTSYKSLAPQSAFAEPKSFADNKENDRHSFVGLCPACEKHYRNRAAKQQHRGSRLTLAQRFSFKVLLPVDPAGCWEWRGGKTYDGYGYTKRSGDGPKITTAHRIAYELFVGPIPPKYTVDHLCRNRSCVNPSHLEAVPHVVNCRRGSATKRVA